MVSTELSPQVLTSAWVVLSGPVSYTHLAKEQIALEVMATTETTAQVRWQALPTQVSYTVSYRPVGADASATQTMRLDPTQQLRSLELRDGYVYTTCLLYTSRCV